MGSKRARHDLVAKQQQQCWIYAAAAAAAKSLQSSPTLCDTIDGSPPGFAIPGILQARTLEWVVISFSNAWKWKVKVKPLSRVQLLGTPWTTAHQASPSMGFSRQECWSGVPLPSPTNVFSSFQFSSVTQSCVLLLCNWNIRSRRKKERERERTERGKI